MTEPIRGLNREQIGQLYDALHLARAAAHHEYVAAEHPGPEEYARGRRNGIEEALTILDEMVDAAAPTVESALREIDKVAALLEVIRQELS